MGLRDFFKKGTEEPAKQPAKPSSTPGQQGQAHDFFNKSDMNKITDPGVNQDVYTVQSGDSLSKIAKKHYGNANAWTKIYNANKDKIGDNPDLIRPGQRFVIPRD
ncbi:LysM peptidoglycan-binding domain-containing protein [uncultured Pontibacter sp.]|uniref:LysM peptidoglycan-binding domain-containing protein n=1 Tax=uncultured Pontibacter sp. TaxID=453356 RepID=UPI002604FB81|nr:LysM peptidoglycan-binding domain-containing protein [uncultured Pontibacter sp.]